MKFQKAFRLGLALVAGIAASLLSAPRAQADTIYACVNKMSGAVRIVTATTVCDSKKETPLSWSTTGPQGPPGPTGPAGPGTLRVLDSNNQALGILYDQNTMILLLGTQWFKLNGVRESGFSPQPTGPQLFYASTDCTGQAYFFSDSSGITDGNLPNNVNATSASQSSTTLYYPSGPVVPDFISYSFLILHADGSSDPCHPGGTVGYARTVSTQTLSVSPPLKVVQ